MNNGGEKPFRRRPYFHSLPYLGVSPFSDLAADAVAVRFDAAAVRGREFFGEIINIKPAATHYLDIRGKRERAFEVARVKDHHHISPPPGTLIFSDFACERFHVESRFLFHFAYRRSFGSFVFVHAAARKRPRPRRIPVCDEHHASVFDENDAHALNAARTKRGPVAHGVHYRNNSKREIHAEPSDEVHTI